MGYETAEVPSGFAPKWASGPKRYVASITLRRGLRVVQFYKPRLCRIAQDPRHGFRSLLRQLETVSERLVRHPLVHHIPKAAMLIAGTDPVAPAHILKPLVPE